MGVEIKVPSVGESVTEGTLARWFKKDGDAVRADEPLFELETEKATTEVAAPAAGTLHIMVAEGQTVAIGTVVGRIEEGAAQPAAADNKQKAPAPREKPAEKPPEPKPRGEKLAEKPAAEKPSEAKPVEAAEPRLSPAARHLVAEEGLDVRRLTGTGPGGRITKEDVLSQKDRLKPPPEKPAPAPERPPVPPAEAKPPARGETRQRLSAIRQRIAERLVAAQNNAAILTTFNEADMAAVLALRERYREPFQKKHGVRLGFMSFFVKAVIEALRAFPVVNAFLDGADIVYPNAYHIGVAVSTEKGLFVPVVRDADRLSFAEIERALATLAQKARDGKISVADLQGGTFTITNGGVFGSLLSTPILNPPQSGILGMHAIQKRPVAVDDQVVIRSMMYLALSYDHRLIDGREAVQFLVRVKECVEDPERLLLEV
jgi:2-oxoglutarate dehydrogenase E2 component (dihydrolipoamide succinyltransferase)